MRGLAALLAGLALWVVVTRQLPSLRIQISPPPISALGLGIAVGLAGSALTYGLLGVAVPALAIGVLSGGIPIALANARRRRRKEALADAWPDLLAVLRGRVAAGESLPQAFIEAARRQGPPLDDAADHVETAVTFGAGFIAALEQLRGELADPTADRILTTIATAHRSGGQRVGAVLAALAASVSDELRLRKAHVAATTEQRLTATIALLAPWILLALTIATNPRSAIAYSSAGGAMVVVVGLAITGAGYLITGRIIRLSEPPRVFR